MNDMTPTSEYGIVTEPMTLTIQRKLPGPAERIWAYLTDNDLRQTWLASGVMPGAAGEPFELTWRNDELTGQAEVRPEGFPAEQRMESEILECDPPRRLVFSWPPAGQVSFDLQPVGQNVLLTLTHSRISDRRNMVMVGAGWHMHLAILAARVDGRQPEAFWAGWSRLRDEYDQLLPA